MTARKEKDYRIGRNQPNVTPGYYGDTITGRSEAARILYGDYTGAFSDAPEVWDALVEWLATDSDTFELEYPHATYYIEVQS